MVSHEHRVLCELVLDLPGMLAWNAEEFHHRGLVHVQEVDILEYFLLVERLPLELLLKSIDSAPLDVEGKPAVLRRVHPCRILHDHHVDWLEDICLNREDPIDSSDQGLVVRILQVLYVVTQHLQKYVLLLSLKSLDDKSIVVGEEEERSTGSSSFTGLKYLFSVLLK